VNQKLAKKIIDNPHLLGRYLGYSKLTKLHSEWIKYCFNIKEDCSLQAHRGSYKTTAVMVIGTLWWLMFHFNDRLLLIRKDFTAASDVLNVIAKLMKGVAFHTLFIDVYGFDYELTTLRSDKITWNLKTTETREGNVNAFGMSPNITGSHGDKVLCDDIITLKDRLSQAEREKTVEYIRELRTNIIDPGQAICFTGTPWHKMDGWNILPKPKIYTVYETNLEAFTLQHIEHLKKTTTPSLFAINYELRHIATENQMFLDPQFGEWDYRFSCYGHLDAKYMGTDTGALTFFSKTNDLDFPYQAIGFKFDCHIDDYMDTIKMLYQKYNCICIYKESNDDKGFVVKGLNKVGLSALSYHESENKHIKISNYIYPVWKQIKWANETDLNYLAQITDYEEGAEPDDAPDSLASLLKQGKFVMPSKPGVLSGKKSEARKDQINARREARLQWKEVIKKQREKDKELKRQQKEEMEGKINHLTRVNQKDG
jgi:hypothetical protein